MAGGRRCALAFAAVLAVAVLAAIGPVRIGAPTSAGAAEASARPGHLLKVLSPGNESMIRNRVRVRLRLKGGATLRSARLNGRNVKGYFKARPGGRAVATLRKGRLGKALKRGPNFLRFAAVSGDRTDYKTLSLTRARKSRSLVRHFRLRHSPGKPARVVLQPSRLHTKIRAKLNNQNVSRLFRDAKALRHKVTLGASEGVKHGRNHLRILVVHPSGQFRRLRSRFYVPRRVSIAGAGRDHAFPAGGLPVRLNGTKSVKGRTRSGRPKRGKLRYRWSIATKPGRSDPELLGRSTRRPRLRTDVPGTYKVKLHTSQAPSGKASAAATGGSTTSTDVSTVTAMPQPYVRYNAFATSRGKPGISIEQTRDCATGPDSAGPPCFYPNPGDENDLQVVVIDSDTLTPPSSGGTYSGPVNTSYETDNLAGFADQMEDLVLPGGGGCSQLFDDSYLVLLSLRAGKISDTTDWENAMEVFNQVPGGGDCTTPDDAKVPPGPFGQIAVPGMLQGRAWTNFGRTLDSDPTHRRGNVVGYLSSTADDPSEAPDATSTSTPNPGNGGYSYTFSFPDVFAFDTRDTSTGSARFTLGDDSVPVAPPGVDNGLAVFSFDPVHVGGTLHREAVIRNTGLDAGNGLDWAALNDVLASLIDRDLGVGITSVGQIGGYPNEPKSGAFLGVLQKINALGANADTFARSVNSNQPYSMLSADPLERQAYESSGVMAVPATAAGAVATGASLGAEDGALTGVLQRGNDAFLFPAIADPSGSELFADFPEMVKRRQVDWLLTPASGATGATCQQVAFAYVVAELYPYAIPGDGSLSDLWQSSDSSQCDRGHPAPGGSRSADTLDGDGCSNVDPIVPGANAADIRATSLTLRNSYPDWTFEPSDPGTVEMPSPPQPTAPFTPADLQCAVNQIVDETNAVNESNTYLQQMLAPFEGGMADTYANINAAASSAENAELSNLTSALQKQINGPASDATTLFWVQWGFGTVAAMGDVGAFATEDVSPLESDTFSVVALLGWNGQNYFDAVEGPSTTGGTLADEYLLYQAQLNSTATAVTTQVENQLNAQSSAFPQTGALVNSDPRKLTVMHANAGPGGPWLEANQNLESAEDALQFRAVQQTYQGMWPQIYTSVRLSWNNACWFGSDGKGCYNNGTWDGQYGGMQPIQNADQVNGCKTDQVGADPVFDTTPSTDQAPAGFGEGNEYHPQIGVVEAGETPPSDVYLMLQSNQLTQSQVNSTKPGLAGEGNVAPFFAQPGSSSSSSTDTGPAAGFFPPDFWQDNLPWVYRISCSGGNDAKFDLDNIEGQQPSPASIFQDVEQPTDQWPTLAPP